MGRAARIVVLCEDRQHEVFCRRLMKRLGVRNFNQEVYFDLPPPGKGAASSFVDARFADRAKAQRARDSHTRSWLLTMRDADREEVRSVIARLESGLTGRRGGQERIALFIPKRSIATWLAYLGGDTHANEDGDYAEWRLRGRESTCHPCVDRFLGLARSDGLPANCPPSLRRTIEDEYPRISSLQP